jgi:hypothetical protein
MCIDDRYLKAEGVPFSALKGCVPVDGDTYDVPAIIETAETRLRVHGEPPPKNGHRQKFGNDPEKHKDYSAVTHVAKGKGIPPFLILYVADHPDTSPGAAAGDGASRSPRSGDAFGAKETNHQAQRQLGTAGDPATKAVDDFLRGLLKK